MNLSFLFTIKISEKIKDLIHILHGLELHKMNGFIHIFYDILNKDFVRLRSFGTEECRCKGY